MHRIQYSSFYKTALLFTILLLSFSYTEAQVGKVKEKAKNDTRSNRSNDSYSGSNSNIFFFIDVINLIPVIINTHKSMLERRAEEPWLVSLDINLQGGYYNTESTSLMLPSIRGNWGLFSTQFRWNNIQDLTGSYKTFDWQVIQFNLLATPKANLRIGTGISYIKDTEEVVNEHFAGLELHFNERQLNPFVDFRWSENYETGSKPRFEINVGTDYRIGTFGNFDVNFMTGFLYQRYYSDIDFYFIQSGFNIRLY